MKISSLYISYNGITEALVQAQVIPYLKGLALMGNKISLLTFDKPELLYSKSSFTSNRKLLNDMQIEWFSLRYHKKPTSIATFFDVMNGVLGGFHKIKKNKITILHARSYVPAFIAFLLKKITRCKFIFDMRGFLADEYVDVGIWGKNSILYFITKFLEKKFLYNSDEIVVLTHKAMSILRDDFHVPLNIPIEVIPTCTDLSLFPRLPVPSKDTPFTFGYMGTYGTWYLPEQMIEFFSYARKIFHGAKFLFLTKDSKQNLQQIINAKGLSLKDVIIQSSERNEIAQKMKNIKAALFFIKPCFSKKASCATKLGEFLSMGIPVVINSGIGDSDTLVKKEKIGVVVENFNQECYIRAIYDLQELLKEEEELRVRCRKVAVNEFSLENAVELYNDIYKRITQ